MKNMYKKMLIAAGLFVVSAQSFAQESPSAAAMQSISTEATNLITDAWPILVAVTVAGIAMKLFRKFANKST